MNKTPEQIKAEFTVSKKRLKNVLFLYIFLFLIGIPLVFLGYVSMLFEMIILGSLLLFILLPLSLMYKCPNCQKHLSSGNTLMFSVKFCPHCGCALE